MTVDGSAVFVQGGDDRRRRWKARRSTLKLGFTAENLFDNFQFTGSACLDGQVKIIVEHFGVKFEV